MDVIPATLMSLLPRPIDVIMTSDASHQQVALLALHNSLVKKLEPVGKNKQADKAALSLFIENNARCGQYKIDVSSYYYDILLSARKKLYDRFYSGPLQAPVVSMKNCFDKLRPGPGSSQGTKLTDFVGKLFHSCLTTYDQSLWQYYRDCIPTLWKGAENLRAHQYGGCKVVNASKLTFAVKNHDISRVINTEASLEMLYQLALGEQIEGMLLEFFNIDLSKQPTINRYLARLGSIYGTFATIDLKSASDLISLEFMRWFLPPVMFQTLCAVRSKRIELPGGELLDLNVFSTMGNGFTFPLQTLVFASIVEAVYDNAGLPTCNTGMTPSFSVFGDDIICVASAYDQVCRALEFAGHTVNVLKSYNHGSFRESCGSDFFRGHDVRGVYVKKCYAETHYYSIFNRLTRWSIRNGVDLSDCLRYLKGLVVFRPVPFDAQDGSGIKLPLHHSGLVAKSGVVKYTQLVNKVPKWSTRSYESNPISLLIGALQGQLVGDRQRNNTVGMQQHKRDKFLEKLRKRQGWTGSFMPRVRSDGPPRMKEQSVFTSSWDWIPQKGLTTLDYDMILYAIA